MTVDELRAELSSPELLAELHHLFWMRPFINRGTTDYGWSCRDHALTVALIATMRGFACQLVSGRANFIQGPPQGRNGFGISMNTHAWVHINDSGTYDLSLKLSSMRGMPRWRDWQVRALVASKISPSGKASYVLTADSATFTNTTNAATHVPDQRFAIYYGRAVETLSQTHVREACRWVNSPLTDKIRKFGPDIYAKAALHLLSMQNGSVPSLASLTQMAAWEQIAVRHGDAVADVLELCGWSRAD